jgi:hypothetical protein
MKVFSRYGIKFIIGMDFLNIISHTLQIFVKFLVIFFKQIRVTDGTCENQKSFLYKRCLLLKPHENLYELKNNISLFISMIIHVWFV